MAEKVYRLNKMMNGNDIYCSVEMPEIFKIEHSIGTIIAPGCKIGNYFKISQNCTLGNNNGCLPVLGEHVYMLSVNGPEPDFEMKTIRSVAQKIQGYAQSGELVLTPDEEKYCLYHPEILHELSLLHIINTPAVTA